MNLYSIDNIELTADCASCQTHEALVLANTLDFGDGGYNGMEELIDTDHDMFLWYGEKCSFINHTTARATFQCFSQVIHPVII